MARYHEITDAEVVCIQERQLDALRAEVAHLRSLADEAIQIGQRMGAMYEALLNKATALGCDKCRKGLLTGFK